jgi:hypothetical protein
MSWCAGDSVSTSQVISTAQANYDACIRNGIPEADCQSQLPSQGINPKAACTNPDGTPAQASTPGSVIMSYAQANINSGVGQYISAQDLDGALSAVVSALANRVLGATGLFGSSRPSGGSGSSGGTATPAINSSSSYASTQALTLVDSMQTRLAAYTAGVQKISGYASQASAAVTDMISACTSVTSGSTLYASQINEGNAALENYTVPLLLNMQKALADVASTQSLIDKVKAGAAAAATPAGAPASFATDVSSLAVAPPSPSDTVTIQSAATVTGGATSSVRDSKGVAQLSLRVTGGTPADQMVLIALNASIMKAQCVPPVVDLGPQEGQ